MSAPSAARAARSASRFGSVVTEKVSMVLPRSGWGASGTKFNLLA
jgi:hypothetical protein